ncbi:MAG: hypothetical protein KDA88_00050 [Planctomycetaceae bacterium]|nr:hypothetical protein [Planctomycetaceae bacterium]
MQLVGLILGLTALARIAQLAYEYYSRRWENLLPAIDVEQATADAVETSTATKLLKLSSSAWAGFRRFVVAAKIRESADVVTFHLVPQDGKPLPAFRPGQYVMLGLKIPGQKRTIRRCYSLSSGPSAECYQVTVKQVPEGLASTHLHDKVDVGTPLNVAAPAGSFHLNETSSKPLVMISGGIGITPFLSMLEVTTKQPERRVIFVHSVRNGREHIRKEELQELADTFHQIRIITIYTAPDDCDILGIDYHGSERITVDSLVRLLGSLDAEFYLCGSAAMTKSLTVQLKDWGVPEDSIQSEGFGGATSVPAAPQPVPATTVVSSPAATQVTFQQSHKTVFWHPGMETIRELAESHGVPINSVCRSGDCGACRIGILAGCVQYKDSCGDSCEEGSCLPCRAQPVGDLVLNA